MYLNITDDIHYHPCTETITYKLTLFFLFFSSSFSFMDYDLWPVKFL